jgi:hypothetical protein
MASKRKVHALNKKQKESEIVLLIDGDVLAYRAAAVAEKREVQVIHKPSGVVKLFKNRTEFKDSLKSKEIAFVAEDYDITDKVEPLPLSIATGIIKRQIAEFKDKLFADRVLVYVSGKNNFRDSLPLPKKYKGNRVDMLRPVHLRATKLYMVKNHKAKICNNCESDDLLIIDGYKELAKGNIPILITVDKDANAYSKLSVYDFTQETPKVIVLPEFGGLRDTGKKITGNGFIWFCFQWVFGDVGDFYRPNDLVEDKFGEKAAFKLLKDCTTKKEALEKVVQQYKTWYPKEFTYNAWDGTTITADYKFMLQLYYCCARMKVTKDDAMDSEVFLREHGVTFD